MDQTALKKAFYYNKTKVFQIINKKQIEFTNVDEIIKSSIKSIESCKTPQFDYESLLEILHLYSCKLNVSKENNPIKYLKSLEAILSSRDRPREESLQIAFADSLRYVLARIHFLLFQILNKLVVITDKQIKILNSVNYLNNFYKIEDLVEALRNFRDINFNCFKFQDKLQEIVNVLGRNRIEVQENQDGCLICVAGDEGDFKVVENFEKFLLWNRFGLVIMLDGVLGFKKSLKFEEMIKGLASDFHEIAGNLLIKENFRVKIKYSTSNNFYSELLQKTKSDPLLFSSTITIKEHDFFLQLSSTHNIPYSESNMINLFSELEVSKNVVEIINHIYSTLFPVTNLQNLSKIYPQIISNIQAYLIILKSRVLDNLNIYNFSIYCNNCLFISFNLVYLKYFLIKSSNNDQPVFLMNKLNYLTKSSINEVFIVIQKQFEEKLVKDLNASQLADEFKLCQIKIEVKEYRKSFDIVKNVMHGKLAKVVIGKLLEFLIISLYGIMSKARVDSQEFCMKFKKSFEKYFDEDPKNYVKQWTLLETTEKNL